MNNSKIPNNLLLDIGNKLEHLNNKINFLQNSMLKMQNELEMMRKIWVKDNYFSQLSLTTNKKKLYFLRKIDSKCELTDVCTLMLEKAIYKTLRTFNEEGAEKAIELIDSITNISRKSIKRMKCNGGACLNNYINIFKKLRDLINDSREVALRHVEELIALNKESIFEDGVEDEIYNLLTPISNEIRLKILNELRKGGNYYSQLENTIGIKAGHLRFHLEKLKDGNYISKEKKKYIITINGLKILKILFELRQELFLKL